MTFSVYVFSDLCLFLVIVDGLNNFVIAIQLVTSVMQLLVSSTWMFGFPNSKVSIWTCMLGARRNTVCRRTSWQR